MEYRILGPLEVGAPGEPLALGATKQRAVLAALILQHNEAVSRERLIDEIWGDRAPDTAVKAVQGHVSRLRRVLPPDSVLTQPPGYALNVDPIAIDLHRFEQLRDVGQAALEAGDHAEASSALGDALSLWRGPALAEFANDPFVWREGLRLDEARLAALELRIQVDLALARHAELIGELESLVKQNQLRERLRQQLMLALYRSGRQAEALEVYRDARRTLSEELGIEPSPLLQELERQILQHDEGLLVGHPDAGAARPSAPHVVARPGILERDDTLARMHGALAEAAAGTGRLVVLAGEPGIGKTAVVDAFL
jgi:DNA-binding SARP family transcriptional activator